MKVHFRDRVTAGLGAAVLLFLAAASYYYSIHSSIEATRLIVDRETPDFIITGAAVTSFSPEGKATRRVFAKYAEHFTDGRMTSVEPRMVSLEVDSPQVRARADAGSSMDGGETYLFTGNVVVTRAGDLKDPPMRFTSTHLTVFPDTNRIETDAPVTMVRGADVTTGIGMTLDNVERTLDIHDNVKTVVMPRSATQNNVSQP